MSGKQFTDAGADLVVDAGSDSLFSANDQAAAPDPTPEVKNDTAPVKAKRAKSNKYADILDNIKKSEELPGGNVTFYLDHDIITAVLKTSKELGISRSKMVNKILRQVLLDDN